MASHCNMLLALLLMMCYSASAGCTGYRTTSCAALGFVDCLIAYQFQYNLLTAKPAPGFAYGCVWDSYFNVCELGASPCAPPCGDAKIGGPNGWYCGNFTCQFQCVSLYADDNGNRWCYWDNGQCKDNFYCA